MTLTLIRVTDAGEPENTGISRETESEIYDSCVSCGGGMDIQGINGIVLQEYLDYKYEGEKCPSCYKGSTVDREKSMNLQDWFNGAPLTRQEESYVLRHAPIDGLREREPGLVTPYEQSPFTILKKKGFMAFLADLLIDF